MKKTLVAIFALAMILSAMIFTVSADDTDIIEVGAGKTYETWSAAVAAAADADGDKAITYHIYGKVVVDSTATWASPRGKSGATTINFVGKTADAEISITATKQIIATDGVSDMVAINYEDLILSRPNGSWVGDLAHANQFFTTWMRGATNGVVTYTDCTFLNGTCANTYNETVYTNCTFKNPTNNALWIMGGNVEVVGGTVEAAKGIKTYNDNPSKVINADISGVTFDVELTPAVIASAIGDVTLKDINTTACVYGAVENGVSGGATANVTIDGVAPSYVAKTTNKYGVAIYTTDMGYAEAVTEEAVANGKESEVVASVAMIANENGVVCYATIKDAINAAQNGDEITLLANTAENVTILQKSGIDLTFNGNGNKFFGTLTIDGGARSTGKETLTIKNVDFVAEGYAQHSITTPKNRFAHNVTIEDCSFTGKDQYQYGIYLRHVYNIVVKNVTGTKLYDLVYGNAAITGLVIDNVTVTNSTNAIFLAYVNSTAEITNLNLDVEEIGVGVRNNAGGKVTVAGDNDITAEAPILLSQSSTVTKVTELVVEGTNNFNSTTDSGDWLVIDSTTAKFDVEVNDTELDMEAIDAGEAKIGTTYYVTLEAAAEDADVAGNAVVIDLLEDITLDTGIMFDEATDVTINGNGHTITMIHNEADNNYSNPYEATERPTGFTIVNDINNSFEAGSVFNINNLTIINEKYLGRYTSGHSWRASYYAYAYAETVNYANVDFIGGVAVEQNANFTECTFTEDRTNMFMVFVDNEYSKAGDEADVSFDKCYFEFAGDAYGTVKLANKDGHFDLSVTNCEFLNCANIPAITVDANVDAIVKNCVFENCTAGSYGSEAWVNGGPVPAVPTSGSLNGVPFGTITELGDVESIVGEQNTVHAGSVEVVFEEADANEEEIIYNINLVASNNGIINRLNSADLTFVFTQISGLNEYEIIASNSEIAINPVDNSDVRYEFHYNGKDNVTTDTDKVITIGQVKFSGYGKFSFAVDASVATNAAHATTLYDNIVESFVPNGETGTQLGELVIDDDTITEIEIAVPTRELAINITFPNAVVNNAAEYQQMSVSIVGGNVNETIALGTDGEAYSFTRDLPYNTVYTVTVEGAGYRTARYSVTLTDNKVLNFWNNVMDPENAIEVEEGKPETKAEVTFLAGDIVKDNQINVYDLSAVVSYFGTEALVENYPEYAKYDLNRDGVIDSKDVAYVLVSWGR